MKVKLPTPCNQNASLMPKTSNGRYCSECDKVLINFTQMSIDEVRDYFLDSNNMNFCGIYRKDQVEINKTKYSKLKDYLRTFFHKLKISKSLITLTLTLTIFDIKSQNKQKKQTIIISNAKKNIIKNIAKNEYTKGQLDTNSIDTLKTKTIKNSSSDINNLISNLSGTVSINEDLGLLNMASSGRSPSVIYEVNEERYFVNFICKKFLTFKYETIDSISRIRIDNHIKNSIGKSFKIINIYYKCNKCNFTSKDLLQKRLNLLRKYLLKKGYLKDELKFIEIQNDSYLIPENTFQIILKSR